MLVPSFPLIVLGLASTLTLTTAQSNPNPILTSSFTWNPTCGPTVACGPSAAGYHGTGFAASNNLTYAGCTNLGDNSVDCKATSIVSGVGKGCGQCWHITPQSDWYPSNGLSVGTSVVVKINDQCTDPGYCDQTEAHPVNSGYGKEVHIDLCANSGVTGQFFGAVGPGVVIGLAQLLPDCSALDNGPYGSGLGSLSSSSSASSSSSSSGGSSSSSSSGASSSSGSDSSSSSGSGSSSSSGSDSSSSASGGSSSSSGSDSSSSSSGGSSSSSSSDSSAESSSAPSPPSGGDSSSSSSESSSSSNSESDSSSSSDNGSSSNSASDSSSNAASQSSSSSNSDSGSSSSSSESDSSSSSSSDSSSTYGGGSLKLDGGPSGSGNWSWSGTKMGKYKLSSGHDGKKAVAQVVSGASNGGSDAAGNGAPVSLPLSPSPPTPTTLVAVVSSSPAPAPANSSPMSDTTDTKDGDDDDDDGDDDDDDCDDKGSDEL